MLAGPQVMMSQRHLISQDEPLMLTGFKFSGVSQIVAQLRVSEYVNAGLNQIM